MDADTWTCSQTWPHLTFLPPSYSSPLPLTYYTILNTYTGTASLPLYLPMPCITTYNFPAYHHHYHTHLPPTLSPVSERTDGGRIGGRMEKDREGVGASPRLAWPAWPRFPGACHACLRRLALHSSGLWLTHSDLCSCSSMPPHPMPATETLSSLDSPCLFLPAPSSDSGSACLLRAPSLPSLSPNSMQPASLPVLLRCPAWPQQLGTISL